MASHIFNIRAMRQLKVYAAEGLRNYFLPDVSSEPRSLSSPGDSSRSWGDNKFSPH